MNASTAPITADEPAADLSRRIEALRVAGTGTGALIVRIPIPGTAIVPSDTLRDLLLLAGSPRISTTDLPPNSTRWLHVDTLARVIAAGEAYVAAEAATNPTARREALMAYYAASDAVDSTPHGQRP